MRRRNARAASKVQKDKNKDEPTKIKRSTRRQKQDASEESENGSDQECVENTKNLNDEESSRDIDEECTWKVTQTQDSETNATKLKICISKSPEKVGKSKQKSGSDTDETKSVPRRTRRRFTSPTQQKTDEWNEEHAEKGKLNIENALTANSKSQSVDNDNDTQPTVVGDQQIGLEEKMGSTDEIEKMKESHGDQEQTELNIHRNGSNDSIKAVNKCTEEISECQEKELAQESLEMAQKSVEQVPESSEQVPESSEQVPESSEQVPESSEVVPESSEQVTECSQQVPGSSQACGNLVTDIDSSHIVDSTGNDDANIVQDQPESCGNSSETADHKADIIETSTRERENYEEPQHQEGENDYSEKVEQISEPTEIQFEDSDVSMTTEGEKEKDHAREIQNSGESNKNINEDRALVVPSKEDSSAKQNSQEETKDDKKSNRISKLRKKGVRLRKWGKSDVGLSRTVEVFEQISSDGFWSNFPEVPLASEDEVKRGLEPQAFPLDSSPQQSTLARRISEQPKQTLRKVSIEARTKSLDTDSATMETPMTENEDDSQTFAIKLNSENSNANSDKEEDNNNIIAWNRKISIVDDAASKLRPPPSPPRNPISEVLYISNLVRPFTLKQLKNLLERTGTIRGDGFWTDKIKSKCYVYYETSEQAETTRNALHGVNWPSGNGKKLVIDYATPDDLDKAKNPPAPPALITKKFGTFEHKNKENLDILGDFGGEIEGRQKDREAEYSEAIVEDRQKRERINDNKSSSGRGRSSADKRRDGIIKSGDKGDADARSREKRRHSHGRRTRSPSIDYSKRKQRKEDEKPAQKAMDDLFKKTEATPCIYWLPLSPEEIARKQKERDERMEEHKRRLASTGGSTASQRQRGDANSYGVTSTNTNSRRDRSGYDERSRTEHYPNSRSTQYAQYYNTGDRYASGGGGGGGNRRYRY